MKKLIFTLCLISISSFSTIAQAQWRPTPPPFNNQERVRDLEIRVHSLEDNLSRMDQRLRSLETGVVAPYPPAPYPNNPYPVPASSYTCLLVDAAYSKTFLGKGSSKLQAEATVRQECGKTVNSAYCNGSVKCSDGTVDQYSRGYFCVVTDAAYSKTFTGQGSDLIEAEAKAKQSCQQSVNAAYCGNVTARCEAQR